MSGGSCKKIQCDNCETIFTGGSRRILEHHVKCKSAPIPLKQWALEELAKMEDRLREKDAVKDMERMFDGIKEEGTQTKLMGTDKDKKEDCGQGRMRQGRCRLGVHTMQSFNVTADFSFIEMIRDLVVQ
jgi:hypothetical protein